MSAREGAVTTRQTTPSASVYERPPHARRVWDLGYTDRCPLADVQRESVNSGKENVKIHSGRRAYLVHIGKHRFSESNLGRLSKNESTIFLNTPPAND